MNVKETSWNVYLRGAALGIAATGLALAMIAPRAYAQQTPDENKTIVQASFDAWSAGTGGPFELLTDAAVWTIEGNSVASKTYPSREAFMSEVIRPFNARMLAGIKPAIRSMTAEGDRVVILFDAQGVARDGEPYVNTYAWFFQMDKGRVVKASAFFDPIAFNDLWSRVSPE